MYPNEEKEIGWYDVSPRDEAEGDPIFGAFGGTQKIFQWHGDTFDIPRSAVHLASSALCGSQAFRYGSNVYGFQFHLEVDEPMINRWLRVSENRNEISSLLGKIDPDQIMKETPQHIHGLHQLSELLFTELIKLFGIPKKFLLHPSR